MGTEVARSLTTYTNRIRLVSRNPQRVNDTDELFKADLTKPDEVLKAVQDSDIVYLTVGLPYNLKVWQAAWSVIMKNVIDACKQYNTKLVFFDNIYMYDENHLNPITEDAPINPPSEKGKVRAQIAEMLLKEVRSGDLKALIARCADYYGPNIKNTSMLTETV
ncbi:MAG: NAD-dependent epimerase/dehydratase family protein, partial [Chlorobi bacterium]|nr:NAD-dependent epimerase/dehydratase family protein [Chlorobiota bacterium]